MTTSRGLLAPEPALRAALRFVGRNSPARNYGDDLMYRLTRVTGNWTDLA